LLHLNPGQGMGMGREKHSAEREKVPAAPVEWGAVLEQASLQANIERWGVSTELFTADLVRCIHKKFAGGQPSARALQTYLGALHLKDLALACACANGVAEAWEYFVGSYRGYLRAAAGAMLKRTATSPEAVELADSLFADLYGLSAEKRGSLLRYFHGRSSLKTWLRAVMAQRHVDNIRAGRKFEELQREDGGDGARRHAATSPAVPRIGDPHRDRYLKLFSSALQTALNNLDPLDAQRLRLYYAEERKLAEVGRIMGEHESSVSRHLETVRGELRETVEDLLRAGEAGARNGEAQRRGLSDAEVALCLEYAAEDAPVDLDKLLAPEHPRGIDSGRKET
jgi:RNA polymerase sigma-70 factor